MADPRDFDPFQGDPLGDEWLTADGTPLTLEQLGQLEALAAHDMLDETQEEEGLPAELSVQDPIELLPIAIAQNRLLQITYQNRKGDTKLYVVEPYEIGGNKSQQSGYLWAYDRNAQTIKSFFLAGLMEIQILDEVFVPRY